VRGALLVVDAAQGVEAQTLANVYQSIEHDHEIVPVINKIDLPAAEPDKVRQEIEDIVGLPADDAVITSAKSGIGIEEVLEAIVTRIPPPKGDRDAPLKAMLVDSWYDPYLGVVILIRVIDGAIRKGQHVKFMAGRHRASDRPRRRLPPQDRADAELRPGEIGFITAQIKDISETRVGDTITDVEAPAAERCPASRKSSRWSSAASSRSTPTTSRSSRKHLQAPPQRCELQLRDGDQRALGFGFRCGFLGLLHLEIIQERLTREYDLDLITTAPSVGLQHPLGPRRSGGVKLLHLHNPPTCRTRAASPASRSRGSRRPSTCPTSISAPS
jgi:GTP-binding protein LepA